MQAVEKNIVRGVDTPRLSALLLQKYGVGVIDTVSILFDSPSVASPIYQVLDEKTAKIDPQWQEHMQERWAVRPADIIVMGISD